MGAAYKGELGRRDLTKGGARILRERGALDLKKWRLGKTTLGRGGRSVLRSPKNELVGLAACRSTKTNSPKSGKIIFKGGKSRISLVGKYDGRLKLEKPGVGRKAKESRGELGTSCD